MKIEQIKKILEEIAKELKKDKSWKKQTEEWKKNEIGTTCDDFVDWLKENRKDLVEKISQLSCKEMWDKGFISAGIIWGKLMKE